MKQSFSLLPLDLDKGFSIAEDSDLSISSGQIVSMLRRLEVGEAVAVVNYMNGGSGV